MPAYAHVHLEDPRTDRKYVPGDEIPVDLPGLDDLIEHGSAGSAPPERRVLALADGTVIREIDAAGIENRTKHVKKFDGDFTEEQIRDPAVETPFTATQPQRTVVADSIGVDA